MNHNYIEVRATDPVFGARLGKVELRTHAAGDCAGAPGPNDKPACCIHNPSAHHMVTWELEWRADTKVMERICSHGVGHPDPDHLAYVRIVHPPLAAVQAVHGCCGCCFQETR